MQPSSHDGIVHVHSRATLVNKTGDGCRSGLADIQNHLDRIVRNIAIY